MVLEAAMQAAVENGPPTFLLGYGISMLKYHMPGRSAYLCNNTLAIMGKTKAFSWTFWPVRQGVHHV